MGFMLPTNENSYKVSPRNPIDSRFSFILDRNPKPAQESIPVIKAFFLVDVAQLMQVDHNQRGSLEDNVPKVILKRLGKTDQVIAAGQHVHTQEGIARIEFFHGVLNLITHQL